LPLGTSLPVHRGDALTAQLEAWRDLILGRIDGAHPLAGASLADGTRAVTFAHSVMESIAG
jgi:hypothetical protein